jgi:hypothetical protein
MLMVLIMVFTKLAEQKINYSGNIIVSYLNNLEADWVCKHENM